MHPFTGAGECLKTVINTVLRCQTNAIQDTPAGIPLL
jgi:hypothetical protein